MLAYQREQKSLMGLPYDPPNNDEAATPKGDQMQFQQRQPS